MQYSTQYSMQYSGYGQKDSRRFEIREGGGCLSVFGFPFFCAGVFLLLGSLKIIPFQNANEIPASGWVAMFLMSLLFAGVGGALLFGRRQTRIDLMEGRIFKEMKIFVPVKSETYLIADYKTVAIRFESGGSDSSDTYPVVLVPSQSGRPLSLYSSIRYADSREFAAAVSQFLKFPLEDTATDHKSLIEPGDATKSLKERLTNGSGSERVPRPISMKCEVTEESGLLRIRVPPAGFKPSILLPFVVPFLIFFYLFSKVPFTRAFFQGSDTPVGIQYVFLGLGALFFILTVVHAVRAIIASLHDDTVVQVGPDELVIAERKFPSVKTTRIAVPEIYDMDYGGGDPFSGYFQETVRQRIADPDKERQLLLRQQDYANTWWGKALKKIARSKGIILKTRRSFFNIGVGLEEEELRYLCFLIKNKLSEV